MVRSNRLGAQPCLPISLTIRIGFDRIDFTILQNGRRTLRSVWKPDMFDPPMRHPDEECDGSTFDLFDGLHPPRDEGPL